MTPAHSQKVNLHLTVFYPNHTVRHDDPHYKDFEAAKYRLKAMGKYTCVVCGTDKEIELHHSHVEFAMQNAIDINKLNEALGLNLSPDEFAAWIDSPGNLEPLCRMHHRGAQGIHLTPGPLWELLRVQKVGIDIFEAKGNI